MKKYYYIKCLLDFILDLVGVIVISPLLLIIALLIKIESKGPVFFLQDRLGQNGKMFKIFKFRTMVNGAINMGSGLRTDEGDPRITKIGNILRKTSLDEIPQIINILKGEMSIIGPRPPVPYHPRRYEEYTNEQKRRFTVKPGISGYAQIILRNSSTWDERIELDLEYVERMSIVFDLYISFMSVWVVLKRKNVYASQKSTEASEKS
ncbi:MAG: sugar transferase [Halanaerobiales bacterium]|nr:sugar transferase [Halanaerobiales bacterium]